MDAEVLDLFENVMRNRWNEVVAAYDNRNVQAQRLTAVGDTVLHLAVRRGPEGIVRQLVDKLTGENAYRILSIGNKSGITALHIAARMGNVEICHLIAKRDWRLIEARTNDGETPLFWSVVFGKELAFYCLLFLLNRTEPLDYSAMARNNGSTILHAAIYRQHIGLAFEILQLFPYLANCVTVDGWSPLHSLASQSTIFQSKRHLQWFDRLIFRSIHVGAVVDALEVRAHYHQDLQTEATAENYLGYVYPEVGSRNIWQDICRTCWNFREVEHPDGCLSQGCKRMLEDFCAAMASIGSSLIVLAWLTGLVLVNNLLKIFTFGILSIDFLISSASWRIKNVKGTKKRRKVAMELLNILVENSPMYRYRPDTHGPRGSSGHHDEERGGRGGGANMNRFRTPILIAASLGVTEVIEKILHEFPEAFLDVDSENRNVALIAAQHKQIGILQLLLKKKFGNTFNHVDLQGNSVLHQAAYFDVNLKLHSQEAATKMRWEVNWYTFVKESMPPRFFTLYNRNDETPDGIFEETHKELRQNGGEWFLKTSESCSVVAALIATVAFGTSTPTTFPALGSATAPAPSLGGIDGSKIAGVPVFDIYTSSAFAALFFSILGLVSFLAIRTSGFKQKDFTGNLHVKLFVGLTSLFASLVLILVSFCMKHYLLLENEHMKSIFRPFYLVTIIVVVIFAVFQLPFSFDLFWFRF